EAGGHGARLGRAVADDARDEQPRIVEGGAEGMRERVAELTALGDRARRLGSDVVRDPARERELREELLDPDLPRPDVRVELAVGALEGGVRDQARPAMSGA